MHSSLSAGWSAVSGSAGGGGCGEDVEVICIGAVSGWVAVVSVQSAEGVVVSSTESGVVDSIFALLSVLFVVADAGALASAVSCCLRLLGLEELWAEEVAEADVKAVGFDAPVCCFCCCCKASARILAALCSSKLFLIATAPKHNSLTTSNAKKPRISMMSSFGLTSRYALALMNSRNFFDFLNVKLACLHSE